MSKSIEKRLVIQKREKMKTVSEVQKEEEFRKWADGYCLELVLSAYSPPEDLFTFISKILKNAMSYARQKTKEEEQKMSKSVEKRPAIQKEEEEFEEWYGVDLFGSPVYRPGDAIDASVMKGRCFIVWLAARQKMRGEMEELQKRLETAIDGYGKAAEKVEQLEAELASLWGESLESRLTEEEKFEKWWKKDGYHLEDGKFYESMRHVWLDARKELREEIEKLKCCHRNAMGELLDKVNQLETEIASLNGHCLIMYQEGQHEHDLMEEWHQKALKLEKWQERSMKDYLDLHVKYKQLESELTRLRGESPDAGGKSLARGRRHF